MNKEKSIGLNKNALKSGSSYMFSNILIKSSAIITAPIFTRLLSTSDYGIASNFAAWLNIGTVILGLGLTYSIGNAYIDFPNKLNKYLASIQTLGTIFSLSFLLLAIFFRRQLAEIMELDEDLVLIMFVYLLIFPSFIFAQENFKFILAYKQNVFISIFNTLGSILFCFLFIYIFNNQRYYGRIIGLIFPVFIMGTYFFIKIIRNGWSKEINKYWKYALKISLPMIPHALAMVVLSQLDRIMIINLCGSSDAGLYSFGLTYASLALIFSNAVMQAYIPWLYVSYQGEDFKAIKNSNNIICLIMCVLTFGIITVAPEFLKLLGSKDFWDAKLVVMPLAVGSLFQYVYNTYSSLELYHKKTIIIAIGTVLAGLINYFLNVLFIPRYGYVAAGYTTLFSYLALAIFHMYACNKICKKRVYDDKYVWIVTILTTISSFLIVFLYEYFIVRYLMMFLMLLIVAFFQKSKVKEVYDLIVNQLIKK
ncbi:lipopolysaccharide biosynthesis protein [Flavobacterium sp. CLA17]|uniref:lipopolysaccharide biosynthesis protein n=1 Tax=Flavobacterium sp. CLA17 TaxID=2724135 RepID=UPI001491F735|nr:oligosaccharide flippase family protein [Flavobacterium sp. CLA17]QSB27964.1 oligosaccharide flippase family protein [Flavobacterium sp. CLA17]